MEDIASKLAELLNNPEVMEQIKNFTNYSSDTPNEHNSNKDNNTPNIGNLFNNISPETLETVNKLLPIISALNKEDDKYTSFLRSLRPLLSESRQKKLDESCKIIKLIGILPLLKNNGIL